MAKCCKRYCLDGFGVICAIFLASMTILNQVILYKADVAFNEITFIVGGIMVTLSLLITLCTLIVLVRTRRRYRSTYEEWGTDKMEPVDESNTVETF